MAHHEMVAESNDVQSKAGWLTKQGGRMKNWRRRWFVIKDTQLLYFKDPSVWVLVLCVSRKGSSTAGGYHTHLSFRCRGKKNP